MAKDGLNRFFRYTQAIQVCSQSPACGVPAVLLRKNLVSLKFVIGCGVPSYAKRFSTFFFGFSAHR
jgi:hypothetical protein